MTAPGAPAVVADVLGRRVKYEWRQGQVEDAVAGAGFRGVGFPLAKGLVETFKVLITVVVAGYVDVILDEIVEFAFLPFHQLEKSSCIQIEKIKCALYNSRFLLHLSPD